MEKQHLENTEIKQWAENAQQWVSSPQGQQALQEALMKAETLTAQLREARRVDPQILHDPVTV